MVASQDHRQKAQWMILNKCACCHDDITVIARHSPWLRGHITVYRCCCLNALAEGYHGIAVIKLYSLYDIVAAFSTIRDYLKTKLFIDFAAKIAPFNAPLTTVGARKSPDKMTG